MRKLKTSDIFAFARVIKASGIRSELTAFVQKLSLEGEADLEKVGIDTMLLIMEALVEKKSEAAIYDALAPIFEMTPQEVEDMPPSDLFEALKELADQNDLEELTNGLD